MNLPSHHAHAHGDHAHTHHPSRRNFLGSLGMVFAALRLHAQSKPTADPRMDRSLAEAANNFLETLRPELRSKYGFAFDDAYRKDWNNLPNFIHPRKGLRMGDLNPRERTAAHRLIQTMMSSQGYLNDSAGHWLPHLMFYIPLTDPKVWGADLPGSPVMLNPQFQGAPEPITEFMVLVPNWSDGTAAR